MLALVTTTVEETLVVVVVLVMEEEEAEVIVSVVIEEGLSAVVAVEAARKHQCWLCLKLLVAAWSDTKELLYVNFPSISSF